MGVLGYPTSGRLSAFGLLVTMRNPSYYSPFGNPKRDSAEGSSSTKKQMWKVITPKTEIQSLKVIHKNGLVLIQRFRLIYLIPLFI